MLDKELKNKLVMFSGGKDSIATLIKLHDEGITDFTIIIVDTDKIPVVVYNTMVMVMNQFAKNIPVIKLNVDRDKNWQIYGMPSDVVPVDYTRAGHYFKGRQKLLLQDKFDCCYRNIMEPVLHYAKAIGSGCIIRGNKKSDKYSDNALDGSLVDGIYYFNPVEDMTDEEVLDLLLKRLPEFPSHLSLNHSSVDCIDCTAYLEDRQDYFVGMLPSMPNVEESVKKNLQAIRKAILDDVKFIDNIVGD